MNFKLRQLSTIQIGFQARDKFSPDASAASGAFRIIQIKDIVLDSENNDKVIERGAMLPYLRTKDLVPLLPAGNIEKYYVKEKDVLFLSRGRNTIAIPVIEPIANTIASYYFYIVRPDASRVLPEYVAWYINQPQAQNFLAMFLHGSHMQMVPKAFFEEMEIQVPSIKDQRAIIELEKLRQKEDLITRHLIRARKKLINGLCMQYLKENRKSGENHNG
jgi:restriction endonuclease S subunit